MTSPGKAAYSSGGNSIMDPTGNSITKRVFFCGVVVEGTEGGKRLPEDVQDLVLSLGGPLDSNPSIPSSGTPPELHRTETRKRSTTDPNSLQTRILELVATERTYVRRIQTLKRSYADPLRQFAKEKHTLLLQKYDAKVLFGNIDALVPVNEAFLADLEAMLTPDGPRLVGGIGDVALKHFRDLKGFEQYKQFYVNREEAQRIFVRETSRRSSPFREYIERVKCEACDDAGNRVGLRELLIEPVQRIPRYTMLFRAMMDVMAPNDSQRSKLVEADQLAAKIAVADPGEETKRALIFRCFTSTIEGFPADLCSSSRRFIDCIDVEDFVSESLINGSSSSSSVSGTVLHCTLLLFDDKLVFVKRPSSDKSGRTLTGLDEMEKFTKGGSFPPPKKKSGLAFRGVVDVTDVAAVDIDGPDIHLFLEHPPRDQGDRWSGRPFRSLSVVRPALPFNLDPIQTGIDKQRFLENLWHTQATYRSNSGLSVARCVKAVEVDSRPGKSVQARTYFNIYQRTAFLQETKKTKVVVHVNSTGADRIPFGVGGPPYAVIQVIPMAGDLSRYKVSSSEETDEDEDDIVQTARVPSRIVQTIHQFGFFDFRTGSNSRPSTPTSKSKSAIFGLDVLSRRLNGRPGSTMGEFFGGTMSSHRRTKSTASRSSMYTHTSGGDSSLMRFSHRSNSTVATSITTVEDSSMTKSTSSRNVLRRGKSPGPLGEHGSPTRSRPSSRPPSRSESRASSRDRASSTASEDQETATCLSHTKPMNHSDWDLNMKLELARKNSQNQEAGTLPAFHSIDTLMQPTIYEEAPSRQVLPDDIHRAVSPLARPTSPIGPRACSPERRPGGPRSPSPQPSIAIERQAHPVDRPPSMLPRIKRVPLFPTGNTETPPRQTAAPVPPVTEPLSIKKRAPSPTKEAPSQLMRRGTVASPKAVLHPTATARKLEGGDKCSTILHLALTTKEDIASAHRSVKRLKMELEQTETTKDWIPSRSPSPDKMLRTASPAASPMSKEALDRMNEMRNLIGRRVERQDSVVQRYNKTTVEPTRLPASANKHLISAENCLANCEKHHDLLVDELHHLSGEVAEKSLQYDKLTTELGNSKRQCELLKNLLADATAEKDIMYEAFNEELDGMYNDVNLPDDEAWQQLTKDLQTTKESRNTLTNENSKLKCKLREMELQVEQWGSLLRAHGLIP